MTADNGDGGQRNSSGGWTPRPDPTLLTTQQLIREQAGLKELVLSIVEGNFKVIDTRLIGMDRALQLLHEQQEGRQQVIDVSIGQLRALHSEKFDSIAMNLDERDKRLDERFDGIGTQFQERDKRTEQLSLADKTAIAAALQAQKEAAGATNESNGAALAKMENNFTKLIEQGQTLVQSVSRNLEDKINDLKSRLDRGEGKTSVSDPAIADAVKAMTAALSTLQLAARDTAGQQKGQKDSMGLMLAVAAIGGGVIAALIEVAMRVH